MLPLIKKHTTSGHADHILGRFRHVLENRFNSEFYEAYENYNTYLILPDNGTQVSSEIGLCITSHVTADDLILRGESMYTFSLDDKLYITLQIFKNTELVDLITCRDDIRNNFKFQTGLNSINSDLIAEVNEQSEHIIDKLMRYYRERGGGLAPDKTTGLRNDYLACRHTTQCKISTHVNRVFAYSNQVDPMFSFIVAKSMPSQVIMLGKPYGIINIEVNGVVEPFIWYACESVVDSYYTTIP